LPYVYDNYVQIQSAYTTINNKQLLEPLCLQSIWIAKESGPSWSWSYGSLIYNYLFNQCIYLLMLWVRTPHMAVMTRCTQYNIIW